MSTSIPHLDISTVDGACVIELARPDMTDAAYIRQVGEEILRVVTRLDRPGVVIDFKNVTRLSSATLGMLVELKKTIEDADGRLRLAGVDKKLRDIFRLTQLHQVMKIHETTREAIDDLLAGN